MARKGVFANLVQDSAEAGATTATEDATPDQESPTPQKNRIVTGMQSSLQDLQRSAEQEIPLDQIHESVIRDRIDLYEGIDELKASLSASGQEVPIKVRISNGEKPYEIVVGRRRLTAARALSWKTIRGFVVELDDRGLLKALSSENAARLETSFIGKAQMTYLSLQEGHTQIEVGELLGISQSLVNFMLRVYRGVGKEIIDAIGDAPGIGRNRWQSLQKLIEARKTSNEAVIALIDDRMCTYGEKAEQAWRRANAAGSDTETAMPLSTQRFEVLFRALKEKDTPSSAKRPSPKAKLKGYLNGGAQTQRRAKELVIKVNEADPSRLLDFIESRISGLMEDYEAENFK